MDRIHGEILIAFNLNGFIGFRNDLVVPDRLIHKSSPAFSYFVRTKLCPFSSRLEGWFGGEGELGRLYWFH